MKTARSCKIRVSCIKNKDQRKICTLHSKMVPTCDFKSCKLPALTSLSARIDIKSAVPTAGLKRHSKSLVVAWKKNGEASFHPECWEILLKASRQRLLKGNRKRKHSSISSDDQVNLIKSEKVMIRHANETFERFDADEDISKMAERVARMIEKSSHCTFFTGAGISTSAGLGDFRGKGGKWTEHDREAVDIDAAFEENQDNNVEKPTQIANTDDTDEEEEENIEYENLRPTFTHEAITKLIEIGHLKYIVSQNCDGLHLLSGVPSEKISELHGNVFVEKCEKCGMRYERPYYVCDDVSDIYLEEISDYGKTDVIPPKYIKKCKLCGLAHRTGRRCENKKCGGHLIDTIINFQDDLEEDILDRAYEAAMPCDLIICLGTTLAVTPACYIVDQVKHPKRIVICNRQATERDADCLETDKKGQPLGARIYGDCDIFMRHLMSKLLSENDYKLFQENLSSKASIYDLKRKVSSE